MTGKKVSAVDRFNAFFASKVIPEANKVETYRKNISLLAFLLIAAGAAGGIAGFMLSPTVGIIVLLVCILPVFELRKIYSIYAKKSILPRLFTFWGKYEYIPKKEPVYLYILSCLKNGVPLIEAVKGYFKFDYPNIADFGILHKLYGYESFTVDDFITGENNGVPLQVGELELYDIVTDSKGNNTKKPIFKGIMFSAEVKKPFKGMTAITRGMNAKNLLNSQRMQTSFQSLEDVMLTGEIIRQAASGIKEQAQKYKENPDMANEATQPQERQYCSRVHLEDPEFEKRFDTYSDDQIEARYLLTTAFMNRFLSMAMKYNYLVKVLFVNQRIYILIETRMKNWFEVPFFKSALDVNNYKTVISEFSRLLSITDTLKLEQDIGM